MKNLAITVKKNEEKILPVFRFSDGDPDLTITAKLKDGASLILVGIFFGDKNSSYIFNSDVIHEGTHTKSLTFIRGVFQGKSQFSNDGMVRMIKGAKSANGYFNSKILLFDDAKGRSVPSLEIDENDVKAGHGSTIGRPDENQLFYLKSRGLSEAEAKKLIIGGFFRQAIDLLPEVDQKAIIKKVKHLSIV